MVEKQLNELSNESKYTPEFKLKGIIEKKVIKNFHYLFGNNYFQLVFSQQAFQAFQQLLVLAQQLQPLAKKIQLILVKE